MDELPPHARELIRRVGDEHDCHNDAVRWRVRARVARAVGAELSASTVRDPSAGHATAGKGWLSGLGAKLAMTTAVLGLVGAGAVLVRRAHPPGAATASHALESVLARGAPAPPHTASAARTSGLGAQPGPVAETAAPPQARAAAAQRSAPANVRGVSTRRDSLADELALLQDLSQAVSRRDLPLARELLAQYRARFPSPVLQEERDGFTLLVRCLEGWRGTSSAARSFARRHPDSVLADRVRRECAPTGATQ